MNITLIISSLEAGGAERVVSLMSNHWAQQGWEVTVLTFDDGSKTPFFPLHDGVKVVPLDLFSFSKSFFDSVTNNIRRTLKIRRAVKLSQADAVISFIDTANVRTLLATRWLGVPVIVSERSDPACHPIGSIWCRLRNLVYPRADAVILQSKEVLDKFSKAIQNNARIIPNPVLRPVYSNHPFITLDRPAVMSVGRLAPEKDYGRLLRAFASVADRFTQWNLILAGDGPERPKLEALVAELGLSDRIRILGMVDNVYDYLAQADLFVQSSRYEGFPNALCEALAVGVPSISTQCNGVSTILENGQIGMIVPVGDTKKLADAMAEMMKSKTIRASYARKGQESMARFAVDRVMSMWEEVIKAAAKENGRQKM